MVLEKNKKLSTYGLATDTLFGCIILRACHTVLGHYNGVCEYG